MSSAPAISVGWLATSADHDALDAREADDEVAREAGMHFEELAAVDQAADDPAHVHRFRGILRNQRVHVLVARERDVGAQTRAADPRCCWTAGRTAAGLHDADGVALVLGDEMHVAADGGVHLGAADLVHRRRAPGHRLDDLRPGDEHLGVVAGHDDEVHQRRRVGGTAGARAADDGDLRHDAGQSGRCGRRRRRSRKAHRPPPGCGRRRNP